MKLVVDLREKAGRDGSYLFAPLPYLNLVVFVFDDGVRDGQRRAQLVFKPYEPGKPSNGNGGADEFAEPWREPTQRRGPRGNDGGGASEPSEGKSPARMPRP